MESFLQVRYEPTPCGPPPFSQKGGGRIGSRLIALSYGFLIY